LRAVGYIYNTLLLENPGIYLVENERSNNLNHQQVDVFHISMPVAALDFDQEPQGQHHYEARRNPSKEIYNKLSTEVIHLYSFHI